MLNGRRSSRTELDLQRDCHALQMRLLKAIAELRLKQVYAQRLEHLLCAPNARIDELTATIDALRGRNRKLELETEVLCQMLTAPPQLDGAMLAPK
jgi:hypothetical protein